LPVCDDESASNPLLPRREGVEWDTYVNEESEETRKIILVCGERALKASNI
jgi:hypothetical protein